MLCLVLDAMAHKIHLDCAISEPEHNILFVIKLKMEGNMRKREEKTIKKKLA